jgi:hypothetical protein
LEASYPVDPEVDHPLGLLAEHHESREHSFVGEDQMELEMAWLLQRL